MWEAGLQSLLPHADGQSPSWEVWGRGQQGLGVYGLHGVCLSWHHRLCEWKSRTWGQQLWDGQLAAQDWGSFPSTCPGRPRAKVTCVRRLPHLEGILNWKEAWQTEEAVLDWDWIPVRPEMSQEHGSASELQSSGSKSCFVWSARCF